MTSINSGVAEQPLVALFDAELECLHALRDVLELERAALEAGDVPALEAVTPRKIAVLERQSEAARQRREGLRERGYADPDDVPGDEGDALRQCRQELRKLAQECHEANRSNGRMIARKQQQTAATLGILRQSDPALPTYSGAGSAQDTRPSRLLGKA